METLNYKINGTITTIDGKMLAGLKVQAFDKDINGENCLGKAVLSNAKGYYEIFYTEKEFRKSDKEKGGADIILRVWQENILLAETKVKNSCGKEENIDITIQNDTSSMYEKTIVIKGELHYPVKIM